jgi:hypothetical protein
MRSFQLSKSWIPCSRPEGLEKCPDALLCREDFASSACIHPDDWATSFECFLVFKNNPESFKDKDWEDSLQPSRR